MESIYMILTVGIILLIIGGIGNGIYLYKMHKFYKTNKNYLPHICLGYVNMFILCIPIMIWYMFNY